MIKKSASNWCRRIVISKWGMKLCDRIWRYSHPPNMEHNRRLWPYVREVKRDSDGAIQMIRIRPSSWDMELTSFVDVPRAKINAVHLILSGPSINEIDYSQLELPCAMGVNGSIALRRKYNISFQYYTIIDESFVRERLDLAAEIVAQDLILFARPAVLKEICLRLQRHQIKCRFVAFEEVDTPAYQAKPAPEELLSRAHRQPGWTIFDAERYQGFSIDPQCGLFSARTVAYDALQILTWLKFTEIYIHGLDLNNANTEPRFYEKEHDRLSSTLHKNFVQYIEPSFRQAGQLLRERDVHVYNLSLNSALEEDVFQKASWKKLIQ